MKIWWCSWAIAHHPYVILSSVFIFSSTCLILPFITTNFPDFSTPQLGFEARGTDLAGRIISWDNLMLATGAKGDLTDNPIEYYNYLVESTSQNTTEPFNLTKKIPGVIRKKPKNKKKFNKHTTTTTSTTTTSIIINNSNDNDEDDDDGDDDDDEKTNNIENSDQWEELIKLNNKNTIVNINEHKTNHLDDVYFCNSPNSNYARVVIGTDNDDKNLWSLEGVLAQCHIDAMLRKNKYFTLNCERKLNKHDNDDGKCCNSWSPANYVAFLSNRTSCLGVTDTDLLKIEELLKRCSYYYRNNHLTSDCAEDLNCRKQVPPECWTHNAPYHLLHYLLDTNFISRNTQINASNSTLKYAMIMLPIAASSKTLDFYNNIDDNADLSYGNIKVLAMEFGLKSTLFDRLLIADSFLLIFGFLFVTICIWIYTGSIILTISTIMAVIFSLGISYCVYTIVLDIKFFPFMNLLAVVVAVGIGSDDAFIFCKVWEIQKKKYIKNNNNSIGLTRLVQETLKHAVPSMLVTSLTTAVAFFASIVSNVTAINCFSLFSGMTVIANFFLMITWLPASIVVAEKLKFNILSPANIIVRKFIKPNKLLIEKSSIYFGKILSNIVIKLRWLWLLLFGGTTILFGFIVFKYPGLRLPDTPNFQYFDKNHKFEKYDLQYGKNFYFERIEFGNDGPLLPLRFVWGIKPIDNGYFLDPSSRGTIEYDPTFDITNKKSQMWLQQFCQNLRTQPFYHDTIGLLIPNCFIESFRTWMKRRCENIMDPNSTHAPCCESSSYPYSPSVFRKCVAEASLDLYRTPSDLWKRNGVYGGIKYLKQSPIFNNTINTTIPTMPLPKIMALIVEYDSNYSMTLSFTEMNQFYKQVEKWMNQQLRTAPSGMKNGWFVSPLDFYELQKTLYEGTIYAFVMSMILAFIVLTLVTLNLLVSFYAILSIGGAILVTVGTLVLLGWRLNVLESVVVSTAIGLAVDFSLHYGVAYRVCHSKCKIKRVKLSLGQMGGPTLMAAITSGVSGALMLPSQVLPYIQIAIFMILVMAISWLYATFFFCPLLSVIGPSTKFAQFHYPNIQNICRCFNIKWGNAGVVHDNDDDDDNEDEDDDNNNHNEDEDDDDEDDNGDGCSSSNKINWRKGNGRSGNMFSESTLSTSSTVCQMHCTDIDILGTNNRLIESIPPSPSSPLIYIEKNQTDNTNNRRK
ncbi:protein dispatched homolog 1 [Aphidius gifuensis]|uniref:protein dispatched homolog 1 n=1 Tax=Aphidius gifuensis TaxID=684658 RepID=UPI001CDCA4C7|nr:protein dispatched homolog 1 [Aphidius gifuensis]